MELIKRVYLNATNGHRTQEVTKEEFLSSAQLMSQITPLEVDILFQLCDMIHHAAGYVSYDNLISYVINYIIYERGDVNILLD